MRQARYAVAHTGDIEPETCRIVPLGSAGECALALHAGVYYAIGSVCPHQNAPLADARLEAGTLICRRHGYRFNLADGDCLTLSGYGLPTFQVDVEGDTIYVTCWEYD